MGGAVSLLALSSDKTVRCNVCASYYNSFGGIMKLLIFSLNIPF